MSSSPRDDVGGVPSPRGNLPTPGAAGEGTRPTTESNDDSPGVPGFRTWRGVYVFIFGAFVAMVIALTFFARHYG